MNQSVKKALKLLDLFTEQKSELTLKEISEMSNIPKPTVYRLLSSLEATHFLEKTKESTHDSKYRLGIKLLELGQLVSHQLELRRTSLPYMEDLMQEISEAVHLVIVSQDEAIYIEKVESNRALRLYTRIGKRSPLYVGSGPRLLLAFMPDERQQQLLHEKEFHFLGNQRPVNRAHLLHTLKVIRKQGYAFSNGEQDADTTGVSYPIYNHYGQVTAALTVSGLSSRFKDDNLIFIKKRTKKAAKAISIQLGYRGDVFNE